MPAKLFTGKGCIAAHRDDIAALGGKCVILTGRTSARKCGALDDIEDLLGSCGIQSVLFDEVGSNPSVETCAAAGRLAAGEGASFLIGAGGGSAQDAAKAASVFAANPQLTEDDFYAKKWDNAPLPVVLVGTTAGTGSEVTDVSVLTDSKHRKHSIHDPRLYSRLSFGDPTYTMSLPDSITLSTGIDILAHCAESYFSKKATAVSRATAVKGIRMLYAPLLAAAEGAQLSYGQREALYEASILGGLSINVTGTCFPHNVGYYLTERFGLPHGFACAVFFPDLAGYVKESLPELMAAFEDETGLTSDNLIALCRKCLPEYSFRITPEELDAALPRWESNGSVMNTAGNVTTDDIRRWLGKFL